MLKDFLKNKAIIFVVLKYFAFGIQLINSVLIAKFLGLYYFGLYGFSLLVLQYLSYANFGVQYSYSILSSDVASKEGDQRLQITGTSFGLLCCSSILLIACYFVTLNLDLFPKYNFNNYSLLVILITILQYFNLLFINIFRINGKIGIINLYYLILPIFQLFTLFFFTKEDLFFALLYSAIGAHFVSLGFFIKFFPGEICKIPILKFKKSRLILKRGFLLMLYNLTFYGILLAARTIVSKHFSVEEFAWFNFANSISNAVFLLLGSLNFLFYPKLINLISLKNSNQEIIVLLERIRSLYLTLTLLVVILSLLSFPVLFLFLPQYVEASVCLQILLISQLVINNSFGYSTLLVQRGKELSMTISAAFVIVLITCISFIGLMYYNNISTVAISVLIGVLFYNIMIGYLGNKILFQFTDIPSFFKGMFTPSLFVPVVFYLFLLFFSSYYILNVFIVFIVYLLLNLFELKMVFNNIKSIMNKKDLFSLN